MGNTQASNSILAKSRALYGRRLTGQDYQQLMNCRDLPEVITYLKSRTAYARALEGADPTRVRRAELEVRLRQNLFDQYAALCRYEMNIGHDFYRYFILKAEVRALANRLQELAAPGSETLRLYQMPQFIRRHSKLDAAALASARDLASLTAVVEGTVYHPILMSFCEKAGFVLDKDGVLQVQAALDQLIYNTMEELVAKKLHGAAKKDMDYLLRRKSDLAAIVYMYRLKQMIGADRAYLLPRLAVGYSNMSQKQLLYLMDAADCEDFVHRLARTPYAREFFGSSFTRVEDAVQRLDYRWHLKKLRFSTDPSVVLFCYIFLAENELTNLTHIIEGVRYHLPPEKIAPLLVGVGD